MGDGNRNLQLELYKFLSNGLQEDGTIFNKQIFAFNIATLTLVFFTVYSSLQYGLAKWWYLFPLASVLFCGASILMLLQAYRVYIIEMSHVITFCMKLFTKDITQAEQDEHKRNIQIKNNDKYIEKLNNYSLISLIIGFLITVFTIFLGIFTIDFQKEKLKNNSQLESKHMSENKTQNNNAQQPPKEIKTALTLSPFVPATPPIKTTEQSNNNETANTTEGSKK